MTGTHATYAFDGKTVLVTGAAGGMGRAISVAFAASGANVLVADVVVDNAEKTASLITESGGSAVFVRTDVSVGADVEAAVATAVTRFGGLDFAVNAAAIEEETVGIAESDDAAFDRIIAVNLRSVYLCLKYEIRAMLAAGRSGAIVNIASTNAVRPQPLQAAYTASKHGVLGLTKSAAIDYAAKGIRVNAICPGAIDTPMLRGAMARRGRDERDVIKRLSLINRFGRPEEIARAVLWLCSDDASFTIGHALAVDGGYLIR